MQLGSGCSIGNIVCSIAMLGGIFNLLLVSSVGGFQLAIATIATDTCRFESGVFCKEINKYKI